MRARAIPRPADTRRSGPGERHTVWVIKPVFTL